jgi:hydrogenase nickel incorporation protein HypA/HybF
MHEMSIALGIVRIAEKETSERNGSHVSEIELEIGELSGIELDSLDFVWPVATKETVLDNAKRTIRYREGVGHCMDCEKDFDVHRLSDTCPHCGSYLKNIIQGKEMRVLSLTIEYENFQKN